MSRRRRRRDALRADRRRARAGRRPGHQPAQRPLPDRLHRVQRRAAGAHRRRPTCSAPTAATPPRPASRCPTSSCWSTAATVPALAARGGAAAASAGSASSRTTSPSTGSPRWRRCWPSAGGTVPELASVRRAVEAQRAIKDDDEIEALRRACAVGRPGAGRAGRRGGAAAGPHRAGGRPRARRPDARRWAPRRRRSRRSWPPAPNSAIPHHRPDATVLRDGDFLKLDFGATVDGYHSDMTRTVVLGARRPTGSARSTSWSPASQAAGRARAGGRRRRRRGRRGAREVIAEAGHGDALPARSRARGRPGDPRGAGHRAARRG